MANFNLLEQIVASLPMVTLQPHFEKISFLVNGRIFVTYDEKLNQATLKLSKNDQKDLTETIQGVYAVPNKWGEQGWTIVELDELNEAVLFDLIKSAYQEVSKKK